MGTCDCHAHVMGPPARYPLSPERVYTPPEDANPDQYQHVLNTLGVARAVLVQPSVYGTDNRLLLDTLARAPALLRGVAVLAPDTSDEELTRMHAAGVRGVRVNLVDRHDRDGPLPLLLLRRLAARVAHLNWHLELLLHVDDHPQELAALGELAVPVVFGHFGYLGLGRGVDDPGFRALLALPDTGRAWVKLTGPYRLTTSPFPYQASQELANALSAAAPARLLWGTDWPHVMLRGRMPNDAELVDLVPQWLPDERLRRQVLVDNAVNFYGFAP